MSIQFTKLICDIIARYNLFLKVNMQYDYWHRSVYQTLFEEFIVFSTFGCLINKIKEISSNR